MKTVGKLHIDNSNLPEQPVGNHLARLLNHLIPGIAVSDADDFVMLDAQLPQLLGFRGGKAERFFADDVQSGFQRRFGNGEVGIVRRGYRYHFNTVRAQGLFAEQRLIIGIAASRRDPELFTKLTSAFGINIKSAGQQGKDIVT